MPGVSREVIIFLEEFADKLLFSLGSYFLEFYNSKQ